MNVFSYLLSKKEIDPTPDLDATKLTVDDNIGESVHIHYRNTRVEFSIDEFQTFAEHCESALNNLNNGNR